MAKAAVVPSLPFKVEVGAPPPAITRAGGGKSSIYAETMRSLAAPKGDKVAQFFVPATVPTTITDPTERAAAMKEEARKISNRISGTARRLKDTKDKDGVAYDFALRTQVDEAGNTGVRVYRVTATPAPAPAAALPGAPPKS